MQAIVNWPPLSLARALDFPRFPYPVPRFCKLPVPFLKILWFHMVKNSWKIQGTGHSHLASSEPCLYLGFSLISLSPTLVLQSCPYLCFSNIHIAPKSRKIQGTGYSPYLGFSLVLNLQQPPGMRWSVPCIFYDFHALYLGFATEYFEIVQSASQSISENPSSAKPKSLEQALRLMTWKQHALKDPTSMIRATRCESIDR